jgi:hypothetical protein
LVAYSLGAREATNRSHQLIKQATVAMEHPTRVMSWSVLFSYLFLESLSKKLVTGMSGQVPPANWPLHLGYLRFSLPPARFNRSPSEKVRKKDWDCPDLTDSWLGVT